MDAMASFRATRFPGAMFDQNYPRSNFNMNPSGDGQFRPQFQRPPDPPFRPFHTPERFMAGNFQKPPFSNFPDPAGTNILRNRPPPPNQMFCPPIPPPNQMYRMNQSPAPPDQVFRINTPPPDQMFRMNTPPPNQMFRMNPSPGPEMFRMNPPPAPEVFRMNPSPAPERFHMNPPPAQSFRSHTPVQRPRFDSAPFDRPWNPMPSFRNSPRPPFQSRPHSQAPFYQQKDLPLQANKKRKQKERGLRKLKDNTERPFNCDTCDRAFVTEDKLKEHLSEHTKCDLGDCTFEAHPKVVALHKRMQHETGYADTINRLQDDAEIQKWREERRRRFPTAENIKKRQAEQAEREARGEVLETKEFGKFKRRPEGNGNLTRNRRQVRRQGSYRRHDRTRNFRDYQFSQTTTVNLDSDSDSDSDSHIKLKKFLGIQSLTNSVSEKCDPIEGTEVISNPHAPNTANEFISSENLSEQNLSKSDSDHVSYADNSSSNPAHDETSFVLNNEKVDDVTLPADASVCEIPENEIECVKQIHEVVTLEDVAVPADESVCEIPENEIECVKQIHKVVTLEDSDEEGPISIPIQMSLNDGCDNQGIDEGPGFAPISKSVEISVTGDSQSIKEMQEKSVISDISCEGSDTSIKRKRNENDSDYESPISIPIQKAANGDCENQDADNEGPAVAPIVKSVENSITGDNERIEKKSCEVSETSVKRKRDGNDEQYRKRPNNEHFKQNGCNPQKPAFQARKSSLLEKLLADDIRHERNVVLQCIRHIVNNDFFGMNSKKS